MDVYFKQVVHAFVLRRAEEQLDSVARVTFIVIMSADSFVFLNMGTHNLGIRI